MSGTRWVGKGDVNAFFGLMLDNVAVLVILVGTIASTVPVAEMVREGQLRFTPEFVLTRMVPGTALGVLLGDLVFTAMAVRLARRTGRDDVTAMPLGLDTPSTFGVAFLVLLPSLQRGFDLYGDHGRAMEFAWHVGLLVLVLSGVFKIFCAPLGNAIRRLVPRAGLLGSLAGIALALIAFLPMLLDGIAAVPLVGMVTLLVILLTLVAHRELPGRFPGALAAVLLGVAIYHLGLLLTRSTGVPLVPPLPGGGGSVEAWQPGTLAALYQQSGAWWGAVLKEALVKLPIMLPFALATIVGGIDCTESAAAAGDDFDTSNVLMTEGIASLAAGLLGGVIQTTPYIGHPAYKKMGGRAGYTLATALFIGTAGCLGLFTFFFAWLPKAAMFPILVFVGVEITAQSYHATPVRHYPAVALAALPALAYLIVIVVGQVLGPAPPPVHAREMMQTLRCLANGFIVTSLLWAAALALILDDRLPAAAATLLVAAVCAFFGVIHSPLPAEQINLPWYILQQVPDEFRQVVLHQTPYHWTGAYLLMALALASLAWHDRGKAPPPEDAPLEVPAAL